MMSGTAAMIGRESGWVKAGRENELKSSSDDRAVASYEDELERMIGDNLHQDQDLHTQKLFLVFQNAATEVTKMFRERANGPTNWTTFHSAAESVTMLYKESLDALKDAIQLGITNGEHRKTKELLCWTRRKQRRHIRTDELSHHLINQSSPPRTIAESDSISTPVVDDLHTFRQALMMDDERHVTRTTDPQSSEQLESFVCQQMADQRARKRSSFSAAAESLDLPKVKRVRYM